MSSDADKIMRSLLVHGMSLERKGERNFDSLLTYLKAAAGEDNIAAVLRQLEQLEQLEKKSK